MRRTEFQESHQEAFCAARAKLLNRGSGVRVSAPAPMSSPARISWPAGLRGPDSGLRY